jgi:RNA polymerase sigma-70 factor (sigma-E family)
MQTVTPGTGALAAPAPTPTTFERFFRDAWPDAHRLASLLAQDAHAGEEIAQEAFARLYPVWGRAERPQAYLRTTIVNGCRNRHRRSRTESSKLPLVATPDRVDFASAELADAIAALPFRQRAVVVLRYWAGLSEVEIADVVGCRPGTVKSLASRALARLEKVIER